MGLFNIFRKKNHIPEASNYMLFHNESMNNKPRSEQKGEFVGYDENEESIRGCLSLSGIYAIDDVIDLDNLISRISIFDKHKKLIFQQQFHALSYKICISDDGKFAVFQFCNNSEHPDGNSMNFVDIEKRTILWQKHPQFWPTNFEFDVNDKTIFAFDSEGSKHVITFDGIADIWKDDEEDDEEGGYIGPGFAIMEEVRIQKIQIETNPEVITPEFCQNIIVKIDDAIEQGFGDSYLASGMLASAYRAKGEVFEFLERHEEAYKSYRLALELNPDVGCKRRFNMLKKKLGK